MPGPFGESITTLVHTSKIEDDHATPIEDGDKVSPSSSMVFPRLS